MTTLDDLRVLSVGEAVRVETEEGDEYAVRVTDPIDYVEPDEYGAGHLEVPVGFDGDVDGSPTGERSAGKGSTDERSASEVAGGEPPGSTGRIVARREDGDSLGRPKLSVRTSDVEEHTGRRFERWETLGRVEAVEAIGGGRSEREER